MKAAIKLKKNAHGMNNLNEQIDRQKDGQTGHAYKNINFNYSEYDDYGSKILRSCF